MGFVLTALKWVIFITLATCAFRIARALIREPNLRVYLMETAKDLKNMYYRYHV